MELSPEIVDNLGRTHALAKPYPCGSIGVGEKEMGLGKRTGG